MKQKYYIAIVNSSQGYTHFSALYVKDAEVFRGIIRAHDGKIIAEREGISDDLANKAIGCELDDEGNLIYEGDLTNLVNSLNSGAQIDVAKEFEDIFSRMYNRR